MTNLDLRKKYLIEASNLIWSSSPSTAAILLMERTLMDKIARRDGDHPTLPFCRACGTYAVHTQSTWPSQNRRISKRSRSKTHDRKRMSQRLIVRSCTRCQRETRHRLLGPPKADASMTVTSGQVEAPQTLLIPSNAVAHSDAKPTTAAAKTAKNRAKARKEGLQTLLDKSKQDQKPTTSFNLMDFMRTS